MSIRETPVYQLPSFVNDAQKLRIPQNIINCIIDYLGSTPEAGIPHTRWSQILVLDISPVDIEKPIRVLYTVAQKDSQLEVFLLGIGSADNDKEAHPADHEKIYKLIKWLSKRLIFWKVSQYIQEKYSDKIERMIEWLKELF